MTEEELKTQKQIDKEILEEFKKLGFKTSQAYKILAIVRNRDRAEAVKWIKYWVRKEPHNDAIQEFKTFFNITEENIKEKEE